jgi:hypothetical protein
VALLLVGSSCLHFARAAHESRAHGFVDFPIFFERVRAFALGGELYVDPEQPGAYAPAAPVYKFPPLYAMVLLPLARPGLEARVYLGHWALEIVLYAASVALLLVYLRRHAGSGLVLAGVLLALNFEPFFETLWRLQLETPLLLLLALAMMCEVERRAEWSGALLGVGFLLKLYPAFLLLYFALRRRIAALAGFAVAVALILLASWRVIGPVANETYFLRVLPLLLAENPEPSTENLGPARYLIATLGLEPPVAKRVAQALVLALVVVSALAVRRRFTGRRGDRFASAVAFSLFVPLMLLAMPNSWVNYQLLLLLPLFVLACEVSRRGPGSAATALLAGLAYAPMLFYWPCADPAEVSWPCARTPLFLGLAELPRGFHEAMVALRGLSPFLLWAGLLSALLYGTSAARGSGAGAGHGDQAEALDRLA